MLPRGGLPAVLLVPLLMLAGCSPDSGQDVRASDPPPKEDVADDGDESPVTLPPEFLECGERATEDELALPDVDLTTATWEAPAGFAESFDYVEEYPPADQLEFWVAEPSPDPVAPNAVAIAIHGDVDWTGIADPCARVPVAAVQDWLAEYHQRNDAQALDEAELTNIAGHPAVTQLRGFPDRTSRAYWLFSQTQVLVIYCQWDRVDLEELIGAACAELVDSVSLDEA